MADSRPDFCSYVFMFSRLPRSSCYCHCTSVGSVTIRSLRPSNYKVFKAHKRRNCRPFGMSQRGMRHASLKKLFIESCVRSTSFRAAADSESPRNSYEGETSPSPPSLSLLPNGTSLSQATRYASRAPSTSPKSASHRGQVLPDHDITDILQDFRRRRLALDTCAGSSNHLG